MSWSVDNDLHVFFYSEYDEENFCHNNKWEIKVNYYSSPQITIESPYYIEFEIKNNSVHVYAHDHFTSGWGYFEIPLPVLLALTEASKILKEEEEKEEKRKQEYNEFLRSSEESSRKRALKRFLEANKLDQ
jgi:hypothetical protein